MPFTADAVADVLAALVRIDSQNPRLVDGAPGEARIAQFCVDWLRENGVDAWLDEVEPGRPNAVARVGGTATANGTGAGPTLVLCAHLDTVSTAGMAIPPLEPRVEGGRLYGRGAYDMKGGLAAILVALAELARGPELAGAVLGALVVDEEYGSSGAADFVRRYPADACIVTEPSECRLIVAHKGFVWLELETRGTAAHGSRWQDGVSAVAAMGRIIAALDEFDRTQLRQRSHPLLGPASLHCATVAGGTGWSTYAPECTLRVERRTLPGESPESVADELRRVVAATGESAALRVVMSRSPLESPADSAIARAVSDAATASAAATGSGGAAPEVAGVAYWMDAAIFADAGAATVNYGPTGAGAHAAVEWVELESVARCARVLHGAALRYCG